MAKYIDVDKAFDDITDFAGKATTKSEYNAYWKSARQLKRQSTAKVKEDIKAIWLDGVEYSECSNCGGKHFFLIEDSKYDFCPNCGADMRKNNEKVKNIL